LPPGTVYCPDCRESFKLERSLPRSVPERLGYGVISLFGIVLFGGGALALFLESFPHINWFVTFLVLVTKEFLLICTLFSLLLFLWALATPKWVESLFRMLCKKLFLSILIATSPIVIAIILKMMGRNPF
jgi:hypothetical protein